MHPTRLVTASRGLLFLLTITSGWALHSPAHGEGGSFDGTYKGTSVRIRGNDSTCGTDETRPATITVRDSKFQYLWNRQMNVSVTVEVKADGTVYGIERFGRASSVVAKGTVSGQAMAFEIHGEWCDRRFSLVKN